MTPSTKKISGRDACIAAIRAAGTPLTANAIATAVVETGVVPTLAGKTPKATLAAQITSGAKKGVTFEQVGADRPKTYTVRDGVSESDPQVIQTLKGYFDRPNTAPAADVAPTEAADAEASTDAPADEPAASSSRKPKAKPDPKPASTPRARRGRGRAKAGA